MLREFGFTVYTDAIKSVSEKGKELKAKKYLILHSREGLCECPPSAKSGPLKLFLLESCGGDRAVTEGGLCVY